MNRRSAMVVALLLSLSGAGFAQQPNESWTQLDATMLREINEAPKSDKTSEEPSRYGDGKRMIAAQLRAAVERGEGLQIENALAQVPVYFKSADVLKAAQSLGAAQRKERETKEAASAAQAADLVKRASDLVRTAKEPRELDEILKELAEAKTQSHEDRSSDSARAAANKIQSAQQFVVRWQDYLAAQKSGNAQRRTEILRNLAGSSGEGGDLLPRSEILAKAEESAAGISPSPSPPQLKEEELDAVVAKAKTLAEVGGVIRQLRQLQAQNSRGSSTTMNAISSTLAALTSIEKAYREFEAGLPSTLDSAVNQPDTNSADVVPLRVQLLMLMLPRYLALPPNIKAQAGEAVQPFLDRVIAEARERGDTGLVARTREARRVLSRGSFSSTANGNSDLVAGQNQEAAGQFMLAVISYQTALKVGTDDISPKLIGERLAAIQSAHAQDYERGMEHFLSPPRGTEYPGRPPFFPGPPGFYGPNPGGTQPRGNPALVVPGSNPSSSATPTPRH